MKKIKAGFLGVMMMVFCMCIMVMTPNTAYAETASPSNAARIGDTEYATLKEAIEKAQEGDTIEILKDLYDINDITIEKSITLTGSEEDNSKAELVFSGSNRGIKIGSAGVEVTLENLDITVNTTDAVGTDNQPRGVQINNAATGVTLNIVNCAISSEWYAINITPGATDFILDIQNSTISGYSAINCWSTGYTINASESAFIGKNQWAGDGNGYGIVVMYGKNTRENKGVSTFTDCIFEDESTEDAKEWAFLFKDGSQYNRVNLDGKDTFVKSKDGLLYHEYESKNHNTVFINAGTYNFDPLDFLGNGANVTEVKGYYTVNPVASIDGEEYSSLEYAIDDVSTGGTVVLLLNVTARESFELNYNNELTIDLNGYSITGPKKKTLFKVDGGTFKLAGEGSVIADEATAIRMSGTDDPEEGTFTTVVVGEDVTISGSYGITLMDTNTDGNGELFYGMDLTVEGTIDNCGSGIWVIGNILDDNDTNSVVIAEGANITADLGICIAGDATVTVEGNITANEESAIEVRAGELSVADDAVITATKSPSSATSNLSGSSTVGAAIAIAQHSTKLPISVTIEGGEFNAYSPIFEKNPEGNGAEALAEIIVSIKNGTFNVINGGEKSVESEDLTAFITGGTYNIKPEAKYLAEGHVAVESGDSYVVVEEGSYTILLNKVTASVYAGETLQLTATTNPEGQSVTWTSSKPEVATVDKNGLVTIVGKSGEATITATVENGDEAAACTITVVAQKLNKDAITLVEGATETLTIDGDVTTIVWSSSDETIATVDQNGVVTATKEGVAKIKAYINGLVELFCDVNVKATSSSAPSDSNNSHYEDDYVSESTGSSATSKAPEEATIIVDEKKGVVNKETGVVTGEGENYSNWVAEITEEGTTAWKFEYADGTMAAGTIKTNEAGETYEQLAWEQINGAWFAFNAEGYAVSEWIYDTDMAGWFYIDINQGMLTGWQLIGGKWYFLQPWSDGKRGIMHANTWIDGWYVDASGAWDGKAQVQ